MMEKEKKDQDMLDFEIRFYEGILKNTPNFIQALIALGDTYTKKGLYQEGLEIDQKLVKILPFDSIVHYNLACSCSLLGFIDLSFEALKKAIELGYCDFQYMKDDPDLENLRNDKRFKRLIHPRQNKGRYSKT